MTPQERVRELYRRRECTNLGHGLSCPNCNGSNPWGPSPEEILSAILAAEIEALEWAANTMKYAECASVLGCEQRGGKMFHGPSCRQDDIDEIRAEIERRKGEAQTKPTGGRR